MSLFVSCLSTVQSDVRRVCLLRQPSIVYCIQVNMPKWLSFLLCSFVGKVLWIVLRRLFAELCDCGANWRWQRWSIEFCAFTRKNAHLIAFAMQTTTRFMRQIRMNGHGTQETRWLRHNTRKKRIKQYFDDDWQTVTEFHELSMQIHLCESHSFVSLSAKHWYKFRLDGELKMQITTHQAKGCINKIQAPS